jgi:hypothetical protein
VIVIAVVAWIGLRSVGRDDARDEACHDVTSLRDAHLLAQARSQYERLADAHGDSSCQTLKTALEDDQARRDLAIQEAQAYRHAATRSARADKLLVAAHAKNVATLKLDPKSEAARRSRETAERKHAARAKATNDLLRLAHLLYVEALSLDPHSDGARRALRRVLRRERLTRADAASVCADAGALADEGALPEARLLYERAIALGEGSGCAGVGLVTVAANRAAALRRVHDGRLRESADDQDGARTMYVRAVRRDASAPGAVSALLALDTPSGAWPTRSEHMGRWVSGTAADVGDVANWLKDNAVRVAFGVLVALALGLLLWRWWFAMRCRSPIALPILLPGVRTRVTLRDFAPADNKAALGTAASFASELSAKPLKLQGGAASTDAPKRSIDLCLVPDSTQAPTLNVQDLSAFPPAAGIAALVQFAAQLRPRHECVIVGQLLAAGDRGVGLQLQLSTSGAKSGEPWTMWADQLKVGPLPDTEAYYALAVHAAEWARPRLRARLEKSS